MWRVGFTLKRVGCREYGVSHPRPQTPSEVPLYGGCVLATGHSRDKELHKDVAPELARLGG